MYTFNIFVFGHDLSRDEELRELVGEYDIEFDRSIGGRTFELSTPYHGSANYTPVILGICITDDDGNKQFTQEVRNSREEDYLEDYNIYLELLKNDLILNKDCDLDDEEMAAEYSDFVDRFIDFLNSNSPEFYMVEASS